MDLNVTAPRSGGVTNAAERGAAPEVGASPFALGATGTEPTPPREQPNKIAQHKSEPKLRIALDASRSPLAIPVLSIIASA
jgi:hypothetical protein